MISHDNYITFNCNYVYIENFNHDFNFCVSKSFYYSTEDALLRKSFTDILNCCDIHFTYMLILGDFVIIFSNNYSFRIYHYHKLRSNLTLYCIMLKNGQTYFKNLAVFTPQDF